MKKWKCTVCGYIHEGEEPPEQCPVCGADRSKFIEITDEDQGAGEAEKPSETSSPNPDKSSESLEAEAEDQPRQPLEDLFAKYKDVTDRMHSYHAHPISVHIPNGVLPVSVFFLFLGILFNSPSMEVVAFYNLIFVVLAMPVVFITGYVDWRTQFQGVLTNLFRTKMICAGIVFVVGLFLMFWRLIDPHVTAPGSGSRWIFFFFQLIILAAAVVAGYLGGKLVFKK